MVCLMVLVLFVGCEASHMSSVHTSASEPAKNSIAFIHVHVVPMDRDVVLQDHTIIVREGRIAALGPSTELSVPDDVRVIEGNGRFVLPGLADMHVHVVSEHDYPLYLANGVTVVRNLNGQPWHMASRDRLRQNDILGPLLYTSGPIVDGTSPVFANNVRLATPQHARETVAAHKAAGYDFVKVYSRLARDVYDAILGEAQVQDIKVVGHLPVSVPIHEALAGGHYALEHLYGYVDALAVEQTEGWSPRLLYGGVVVDTSGLAALARETRKAGVWNCPTLVALDRWVPPDEVASIMTQSHMQWLSPEMRSSWRWMRGFLASYLQGSSVERRALGRQNRRRIVKALQEAGADLLLCTDAGGPYMAPGFSIHAELQNLVEAGLTPYEALRTGTWNAAVFLDDVANSGSLGVGKRADLVLVEHNPLDDVAHLQYPIGVMVRGQWLTQEDLQRMLEH